MRFVVLLVSAALLAFLFALVCIVASIYPRASPSSASRAPDNGSVSGGALVPSLGALHGSGSHGENALDLGLEPPPLLLHELGPAPGTADGARPFPFSRMVCTRVPQGECSGLGTGGRRRRDAEWSELSAAAERLRSTVQLQQEQIRADRRTITELTGKLTECERGLEQRSAPERGGGGGGAAGAVAAGTGARSGAGRRLMAGDEVSWSAATRAVEELERAIMQLQDRIERLEMEMVPVALNHSEAAVGAPGVGSGVGSSVGPASGRVDDVGSKLEQKMKHLEDERKNLRKETQNQHQHIDHGLDTLQQRVTQLEHSLSGSVYPQGYKLSFPMRTNYMYGLVRRNIPEMYSFTACMWLNAGEGGIGTPFSYAVPQQPNELVLLQGVHKPAELLLNDKVAQLPLTFPRDQWQHVCVSWTLRDGVWKAYQGGKLKGRGEGLSPWHPIRPGGVLVLGQEQDTLGGRFDASQALVGEMSLFHLWDRVLPPGEVAALAACGATAQRGNVVSWGEQDVDVFGGALKESGDPCFRAAGPRQ